MSRNTQLQGRGVLRQGDRDVVSIRYTVYLNSSNGQASVVEFSQKPPCADGEIVTLTLEDGRIVNCHVLDDSPYCAVVGEGPMVERRSRPR